MMVLKKIIEKYKGRTLAVRRYKSPKPFSYSEDFIDVNKLLFILYEVDCGEMTLTNDGFGFLDGYYGEDKVADMIQREIKNGVDYSFSNEKDVREWFRGGLNTNRRGQKKQRQEASLARKRR